MNKKIGIVGAGIIGRLLALKLREQNFEVCLFEKNSWNEQKSCSHSAAGMIAPFCELDTAEYLIARLGIDSYEIWPSILKQLDRNVYFNSNGSLVIAHQNDLEELVHLKNRVARHPLRSQMQDLDLNAINKLEPDLNGKFTGGVFYPLEAALDNRGLLDALLEKLQNLSVKCYQSTEVTKISPFKIETKNSQDHFDLVFDCRGISAKKDLSHLRGVRGELLIVHAPDVHLNRPIRLLHPKYPVYIVPKEENYYYIGATAIESEDTSNISIRTCLELMSSAYSVHQGFAEARLVETVTNLRPAFDDNLAQVRYKDGLVRINGLYRHGFLLGPKLIEEVVNRLLLGKEKSSYEELFINENT